MRCRCSALRTGAFSVQPPQIRSSVDQRELVEVDQRKGHDETPRSVSSFPRWYAHYLSLMICNGLIIGPSGERFRGIHRFLLARVARFFLSCSRVSIFLLGTLMKVFGCIHLLAHRCSFWCSSLRNLHTLPTAFVSYAARASVGWPQVAEIRAEQLFWPQFAGRAATIGALCSPLEARMAEAKGLARVTKALLFL